MVGWFDDAAAADFGAEGAGWHDDVDEADFAQFLKNPAGLVDEAG